MTANNRAVPAALAVFEAINTRDLSGIEDAVTADFVDHGSPVPMPPGPGGYRQILGFVTGVLSIRYDLEELFCTDDRIVIRAVVHGVGVDEIHGAGSAGKTYLMPTVHIYRTEGDRLAEHWGMRDEYGARIQLGVIPAPDPAAFAALAADALTATVRTAK